MSKKKPVEYKVMSQKREPEPEPEMIIHSDTPPITDRYFVLSHTHILQLQLSVNESLALGFELAGGVSSYFDKINGYRIFLQAVVRNTNES